jgi:predicted DNA-binding protein
VVAYTVEDGMKARATEYQYAIRLDRKTADALKARAAREDRPISRILRAAIRDYLGVAK